MNPAPPLSVMSTLMFTVVGFFAVVSGDRRNDQRRWGDHVFTNRPGICLRWHEAVHHNMPHGQSERQMAKCVPPNIRSVILPMAMPPLPLADLPPRARRDAGNSPKLYSVAWYWY
ncbi:hypothetical protein BJV77DRAFT_307521 [Russula vinacea]|nr:hypothetical protein BJV77DRAFT_307521 [Russula vinacea]